MFERVDLPQAEVYFDPHFFSSDEADDLERRLMQEVKFEQTTIRWGGKTFQTPRLTCWMGDAGKTYTYSGRRYEPCPWTPTALEIKTRIETWFESSRFNSVLFNLYRDGHDSVSWHADDEKELGPTPNIVSVSFGATRKFQMKHTEQVGSLRTFELGHGSCLVMGGATQRYWQHTIPKERHIIKSRLNLTFRTIF